VDKETRDNDETSYERSRLKEGGEMKCEECGLPNGEWTLLYADNGVCYVKCNCTTRQYQRFLEKVEK